MPNAFIVLAARVSIVSSLECPLRERERDTTVGWCFKYKMFSMHTVKFLGLIIT